MKPAVSMQYAGIVLCGGKSTRMGLPKATLPFGPELMLQRVVRLLSEVVSPIIVVAAPDQPLIELPGDVQVVRDRQEGRGPLEGLAAGLSACEGLADAAYATSCDVPLLVPAFVQRMLELLGDAQIAVPREGKFHHPLAAVYRTEVLAEIEQLLAEDRMRPVFLYERVTTREITSAQWQDVDPESHTLANLNRPEDYLAALQQAGFEPTSEILRQLNG